MSDLLANSGSGDTRQRSARPRRWGLVTTAAGAMLAGAVLATALLGLAVERVRDRADRIS